MKCCIPHIKSMHGESRNNFILLTRALKIPMFALKRAKRIEAQGKMIIKVDPTVEKFHCPR